MAPREATRSHPGDGSGRRPTHRQRSAATALRVLRASIDTTLPPAKKRAWTGALREIAGEAFVADRERHSVRWWATEMLADLVAMKTVERWAQEDGWIARRERMVEVMREEVLRGIATEHARLLLRDLRALDRLHEALVGQLSGLDGAGAVPSFTSRAEAFRALVALDRRRDEKRRLIVDATPPPPAPSSAVLRLAPEVARAMAAARLRAERELAERAAAESGK